MSNEGLALSQTAQTGTGSSAPRAYCLRCREKREVVRGLRRVFANGFPGIQGQCAVCGAGVLTIVKEPKPDPPETQYKRELGAQERRHLAHQGRLTEIRRSADEDRNAADGSRARRWLATSLASEGLQAECASFEASVVEAIVQSLQWPAPQAEAKVARVKRHAAKAARAAAVLQHPVFHAVCREIGEKEIPTRGDFDWEWQKAWDAGLRAVVPQHEQGIRGLSRASFARIRAEFGMDEAEYVDLFNKQEGECAICGRQPLRLLVDHCHPTGVVRALLCGACNVILGQYQDDPSRMRWLAERTDEHWIAIGAGRCLECSGPLVAERDSPPAHCQSCITRSLPHFTQLFADDRPQDRDGWPITESWSPVSPRRLRLAAEYLEKGGV